MYQKNLINFRINLPIKPTRNENSLNKFFNTYLERILSLNIYFILAATALYFITQESKITLYLFYIITLNIITTIIITALFFIVPILFCSYQKHVKHNEDFQNIKYYDFIQTSFNFHFILSYYLWKKKFKNTKCFIKNDMFVLEANSNHSFIENIYLIEKNPIKQNQFKGKLFLVCEYIPIL